SPGGSPLGCRSGARPWTGGGRYGGGDSWAAEFSPEGSHVECCSGRRPIGGGLERAGDPWAAESSPEGSPLGCRSGARPRTGEGRVPGEEKLELPLGRGRDCRGGSVGGVVCAGADGRGGNQGAEGGAAAGGDPRGQGG